MFFEPRETLDGRRKTQSVDSCAVFTSKRLPSPVKRLATFRFALMPQTRRSTHHKNSGILVVGAG